jgi:hypothetical protein
MHTSVAVAEPEKLNTEVGMMYTRKKKRGREDGKFPKSTGFGVKGAARDSRQLLDLA